MERWSGKRYHSWSWHLQSVFGEKVAKISLDAGFTCPHRRGTSGGCIYCSPRGSGDFAGEAGKTIPAQFQEMAAKAREKWPEVRKFIAYFQAYTNTLAPVSQLESLYNQALEQEGV